MTLHVLLLVGGASPEREVSKHSSKSIYTALIELGHRVTLLDPAYGLYQPRTVEDFFRDTDMFAISHGNYLPSFQNLPKDIDVAFIGLHGKWGEDGTIQGILELLDIPYTGSGVLASALAMDKDMSKVVMKDHGVNVPVGLYIQKDAFNTDAATEKIAAELGFPCVVKPNDQGSTCGLTICESREQLAEAYTKCFAISDQMIVEKFIAGRELTVGILGDTVLPVLEIRPLHDIYDYECKYTHGMSEYIVPANVTAAERDEMQRQTALAFKSLGCKGYGRADFRLTPEGEVFCLEMNTLPGMTSTSLIPKMAKHVGIDFTALIKKILEAAL
ncbi:MAG: D-alanine--D-alanine ligase [Ignavibacteriales bacterium]|nr:D-alanine--D-alanine ligase [Ignavibacteriales bacterium]